MRCWLGKSLAGAALALAAGALALPTPASADVTVDPDVSVQGGAPRLTFTVSNSSPTATLTQVVLTMPDSMPIAETYPLSIDDWAPTINWKPLAQPLPGVHGSNVTEAVTDITWFAMPGKGVKPGQSADLLVTLGPLPVADQVVFKITEKYDDGSSVVNDAVPAAGATAPRAAAVLRLIPDTVSDAQGGHHGGTATETETVASVTDEGSDTGLWVGIIGLAAGLVGGGAIMWLFASRRRPEPAGGAELSLDELTAPRQADESDTPDSAWRYRGDSPEEESSAEEDAPPKIRAAAGKTS
ncbi:DUF1775 domain-containing protein [Catenuloplanes atrovinosus]|uniref:Uncharacterized protein YcnI n=1 Tax=Catenuloplanes atrovinosus TaxID=137266 RepID=A0AAE3YWT0_9ACTN|nr:DUF1775 domain-containing protein [Catenuloplanes atrovinosus]MDR7279843.1 uncharacterized protein YcnI [Catenuloplanes atrovinosus]